MKRPKVVAFLKTFFVTSLGTMFNWSLCIKLETVELYVYSYKFDKLYSLQYIKKQFAYNTI